MSCQRRGDRPKTRTTLLISSSAVSCVSHFWDSEHHTSYSGYGRVHARAAVDDARDGVGHETGVIGEADLEGGPFAHVAGPQWERVRGRDGRVAW